MNVFLRTFDATLARLLWPAALGLALTGLLAERASADLPPEVARAALLWLHLPAFLCTAACLAHWIDAWPLLAGGRPEAALLARAHRGPLAGAGATGAGALCALALVLAVLGATFPALLAALGHRLAAPRRVVTLRCTDDRAVLDEARTELRFLVPTNEPLAELRLAPIAFMPGGPLHDAPRVRVLADGEAIHEGEIAITGSRDARELEMAPRLVREIVIRREPGQGHTLIFEPGSLLARGATPRSLTLDAALAALGYLLPALCATALICLLRGLLALPLALALALFALVLGTVFDLTPAAATIRALARGAWLPAELATAPLARAYGASFSWAVMAMILAMARRRTTRA